jgi:DNA-binding CsgD family transcriptional regulator
MMTHNKYFRTACQDVKAICDSTLNKKGIHFFNYARMFDDGSCYILSNNENVIEYLFESESPIFAPIPSKYIQSRFSYYIPENGPYQKVMHDVKDYFNIAHGFDIFEVHPGYVDVCCFAGNSNHHEMINYYLNHTEFLNNFWRNFKEQASGLISRLNKNIIQLPEKMQLNFKSDLIACNTKSAILTKRQKQCLFHLLKGMTIKEIANSLQLSPRTVEHYFETIKVKLNCKSRFDLFEKAKLL